MGNVGSLARSWRQQLIVEKYELLAGAAGGRVQLDEEQDGTGSESSPEPAAGKTSFRHSIATLYVSQTILLILVSTALIVSCVANMRFLRQSQSSTAGIKSLPHFTPSQIEVAASRHLTQDQCLAYFPGLYE